MNMPNALTVLLIPLLPLAGFVLLGLLGRSHLQKQTGFIATLLLLAATVLALYTAGVYFTAANLRGGAFPAEVILQYNWLPLGKQLSISMSILLDALSVMMLVVVTVVSLMVHLYSISYMKGEARYATYFAYLGLFTFSMLGLVLAGNLFQTYVFWELVGVSSFLLIGYYFDKPSAVAAAKKAFIVTRFADLGFLAGILILGFYGNSFDYQTLFATLTQKQSPVVTASFAGASALTWGLTLVFMGGAGKSAMFPLHIWLPDAMEGPTPVSALIHAATMVVAGVFLVARMLPLYALSATALAIVTWVGGASALLAAIIACTQTDIKRVLAYSTMSQIGLMMLALGLTGANTAYSSGYSASLFHLFTHAFFKSLLFLGAGVIIHYVHSNDLKDMGGLRKHLPVTHITFLIGCLAIAGIWPLAGFFSKEEILFTAWQANKAAYAVAILTSALTAFYMFRLYFSIFWNKPAAPNHHPHEAAAGMLVPLVVLALLAAGAGFLPFGKLVFYNNEPVTAHLGFSFALLPLAVGVAGILLAAVLYRKQNEMPERMAHALNGFYRTAANKFYIDELYLFVTQKILFNLVGRPAAWADRHIVDGSMNGLAKGTAWIARTIKGLQSGHVQSYTLWFFGGVLVLAVMFLYLYR